MTVRSILLVLVLCAVPRMANAQVVPCWGDITLDHHVNINDLLEVISNWGECIGAPPTQNGPANPDDPPTPVFCAADISPIANPDGFININDLLLVIATWGECTLPPPSNGQGYVIWCEDWANANYLRWTSAYNNDQNPCTVAGFNTEQFQTPGMSMKSQVTCAGGVNGVHRGYGGLRFFGEVVLPNFATPSAGGIIAPYGMVIQFRNYLSVPYVFNAQDFDLWMSMLTVTNDCSNAWHGVITLNIDDDTMRLRPQHVQGVQYAFGAPAFPRDVWNRVTVYLNIGEGVMHVWQNGIKIANAWFQRPSAQACQFHFGLYCSGANSNITYYEDDFKIIKLTAPITDFIGEPVFPGMVSNCMPPPE